MFFWFSTSGPVIFIICITISQEPVGSALQQPLLHSDYLYSRTSCNLCWLFIPPSLCLPSLHHISHCVRALSSLAKSSPSVCSSCWRQHSPLWRFFFFFFSCQISSPFLLNLLFLDFLKCNLFIFRVKKKKIKDTQVHKNVLTSPVCNWQVCIYYKIW